MEMEKESTSEEPPMRQPHVLFLPFPLQGHVKPMLTLAKLIYLSGGFHVTFVNSDHNHRRLLLNPSTESFLSRHPNFHFTSLPDGLPLDHPRCLPWTAHLLATVPSAMKPRLRELLEGPGTQPPPTCVVADGILTFAMDVAEEMGIPTVLLRTYSAFATWLFFHVHKLVEVGEIPVKGEDMERPITCVPGLEPLLRPRDLSADFAKLEPDHPIIELLIRENLAIMSRATALVLDTFDELEAPIISKIKSIIPNTYSVGPIHALLKARSADSSPPLDLSTSLWNEDWSCISWLDSKPPKSVVYVSFGSIVVLSQAQIMELWHGLVNSGKPFLWTIRPDMVEGQRIPEGIEQATDRGLIVSWAPQEEVLAHPAVGCFLTHSGWNSTLESIFSGTPMIGWPIVFDQLLNSLCIERLWRNGMVGMNGTDGLDRVSVEKMVRVVMDDKRDEIMESADRMAKKARESVADGGSSWRDLDRLIDHIRSMCLAK